MTNVIRVAIVNNTCGLNDPQLVSGIAALQTQVSEHLRRAWQVDAQLFLLEPPAPSPGAWGLMLRDTGSADPGIGSDPEVTTSGLPLADVFLGDAAPGQQWTHAASRVLLNLLVDPPASRLVHRQVDAGAGQRNRLYVHDITAPCASYEHGYDVGGWRVSDFVLGAWFSDQPPGAAVQLDHLGLIQAPFQVLPGERVFAYDLADQRWLALAADRATGAVSELPEEPTGTRLRRLSAFMDARRSRIRLQESPCPQRPRPGIPGGP